MGPEYELFGFRAKGKPSHTAKNLSGYQYLSLIWTKSHSRGFEELHAQPIRLGELQSVVGSKCHIGEKSSDSEQSEHCAV